MSRGFTLIETLIAISVLVIAITVPLRIVSQSIKTANYARERLTAVYLAEEGIELMHRVRDSAGLGADITSGPANATTSSGVWGWYDTVRDTYGCGNVSGCSIDPETGTFVQCASGTTNPCKIYRTTSGSAVFYTHEPAGNTETPFIRSIRVEPVAGSTTAAQISVRVSWKSAYVGDTSVEFQDVFTNWMGSLNATTTP